MDQKIAPSLRAALAATPEELEQSDELSFGIDAGEDLWELIVKYADTPDVILTLSPQIEVIVLYESYALLRLPRRLIAPLSALPEVIYIEKPKRLFFETLAARQSSCITALQDSAPDARSSFSGRGVLVAVIDSGIDIYHPDFRNADGSSRIRFLWDQSISPDPSLGWESPEHYPMGVLLDREQINGLLADPPSLTPGLDLSGHGTHVAGIAAGNGSASGGINRGVAYESELVAVKLGSPSPYGFPSTSRLMAAVDFCVRLSLEYNQPVAINLSFGNTYGSHSGTSLLETYLDAVSQLGRVSIIAGTGNEGAAAGHTGGVLSGRMQAEIPFSVSPYQQTFSIQLWKSFWDEFVIRLEAPRSGNYIDFPSRRPGAYRYVLGSTNVFLYVGEPSPYSIFQEIYFEFFPASSYVDEGIWSLRVQSQEEGQRTYDLWMPVSSTLNPATQFLYPTPETTLTIPSTASRVITVAAYNSHLLSAAPFSGRGFTWKTNTVKPELAAPGVEITSCAPGGGYETRTGTSMAAPFVTGSAAVMMQWGIVEGNDPYLYGDKLKAYLIDGAKKLPFASEYPNPEVGWGALCLRDSLP